MDTSTQHTIGLMAATILASGNRTASSQSEIESSVRIAYRIIDAIEEEERSRQALRDRQARRAETLPVGHATTDYEPV